MTIKFKKAYGKTWRTIHSYYHAGAYQMAKILREKYPACVIKLQEVFVTNIQTGEEYNEFIVMMTFDNDADEAFFLLQTSEGIEL